MYLSEIVKYEKILKKKNQKDGFDYFKEEKNPLKKKKKKKMTATHQKKNLLLKKKYIFLIILQVLKHSHKKFLQKFKTFVIVQKLVYD